MPSVAITGDVHHYLGNHPLEKKEPLFAKKYLDILYKHDAKATLFVTGKCIEENPLHWKKLEEDYPVELGGHTYYAFQPQSLFYGYKDLFGRFGFTYGPVFYQLLDISKTVNAFENADMPVQSWRSHAYRGDKITGKLLPEFDIKYISELKIVPSQKLINLPITTYPDDHVFLATLTGKKYDPEKEMKKVNKSIFKSMETGKDFVVQLHPSSMKLYDDFSSLRQIVRKLKSFNYEFETIKSLGEGKDKNLSSSKTALAYYR